jgi:hypothetical protein
MVETLLFAVFTKAMPHYIKISKTRIAQKGMRSRHHYSKSMRCGMQQSFELLAGV